MQKVVKKEVYQTTLSYFIIFISQRATSQSSAAGTPMCSMGTSPDPFLCPALLSGIWHKQHFLDVPQLRLLPNPLRIKVLVTHGVPPSGSTNLGTKEISPSLSPCSPVRGLTSPKCQISVPSKIFYSSEVQREQ